VRKRSVTYASIKGFFSAPAMARPPAQGEESAQSASAQYRIARPVLNRMEDQMFFSRAFAASVLRPAQRHAANR